MNLTRVLNNALPELPARVLAERPPKAPPDAVFKEVLEDGKPVVRVLVPSLQLVFRFPPAHWKLIQLFDGKRSYDEIAELYSADLGAEYSVEDVRDIAGQLESMNFWYKTPQERNVQLMQMTGEERRKVLKAREQRFGDLSEVSFPAVNPDKFITWLHNRTSFVYTWWFTLLTLFGFGVAAAITIAHWREISQDTLTFFSFTDKSWSDFAVFYLLVLLTLCWHETAHAHACKHCGGRVPAMGLMLIYLTPAFFTDTTEGYIKGTRIQRFVISMAGAWSELIICAVATPIWWNTPPGTSLHNVAYLLMLMTGIAGVLLNWNPLMKLDGYFMLCEVVGIADLKEESTAYVSAWVKRHVWKLPVEVPYVPKQRRLGFVVYALLSGAYSYTVLFVVARFVGNICRNFNPEWGFIPELGTAFLIFRSRLRAMVNFMKFVYLDKKDSIQETIRHWKSVAVGAGALVFVFLPLWHDHVMGRFVLEPVKVARLRARVPGKITDVIGHEGMEVKAGEPLLEMRNISLQGRLAQSQADLSVASMLVNDASLHYRELGPALIARDALEERARELEVRSASLQVVSPINGILLTPRLMDRVGSYVPEGTELLEIADVSSMRARIDVSEYDVGKIGVGAPAKVQVSEIPRNWDARARDIATASSEIEPELAEKAKYSGLNPLNFYVVDLVVANPDGILKPGMVGVARINGRRRSLAGFAWHEIVEFFARKAW